MPKKALVLAIFLLLPLSSYASINADLRYGVTGTQVSELQEFLISKGFLASGNATGNFYSLTLAGVKAYQTSAGVPSTGYVGPLTRAAINADLTTSLESSNQEEQEVTGTITPVAPSPAPVEVTPVQVTAPVQNQTLGSVSNQPITITLGSAVCRYGMTSAIPVIASGDWSTIKYTYNGYVLVGVSKDGSEAIYIKGQPRSNMGESSASIKTGSLAIENIADDYNVTGTAYDANSKALGSFSQTITIPQSCRTPEEQKFLPVIDPTTNQIIAGI